MVFGPSDSFYAHVDDLEDQGYAVLRVDDYGVTEALKLIPLLVSGHRRNLLVNSIDEQAVIQVVVEAAAYLRDKDKCTTVIALGFGFGGIIALKAAAAANVDGTIAWYPHLVVDAEVTKEPANLAGLTRPTLVFYGAADKVTPGSIPIAQAVARQSEPLRVEVFPGAGHAFADRHVWRGMRSPLYDKTAAAASWTAALRWIHNLAAAA